MTSNAFSLSKVATAFACVRTEDGNLSLREYTQAYYELNKFFPLLGRLMGFVASDVTEKAEVLMEYVDSAGEPYRTIQSMIKHEVDNNLTIQKSKASGSRTLLRLHRALDFIIQFFENVVECKTNSLAGVAFQAYSNSLAQYHSWVVRKGVQMAVYMLPYRKDLIAKLGEEESDVVCEIKSLADLMKPIYEETQRLYTEYKLHELP